MAAEDNLQDVIRCNLCETYLPPLYCDICLVSLCMACVGKHLLDGDRQHKVVPFGRRRTTCLCQNHGYICELRCEQCNIPVCAQCISLAQHELHHKTLIKVNMEIQAPATELPQLIIEDINLNNPGNNVFCSTIKFCLHDNTFWTCGAGTTISHFTLQGEWLESIETPTGNNPSDIAVKQDGCLVFSDHFDRSLWNIQTHDVLRVTGWRPRAMCTTSSNDLLVFMISDDYCSTKIGRYSGTTETQTIYSGGGNHRLYSPDPFKYICENRNLDICVADNRDRAVVVVKGDGSFRFRYIGFAIDIMSSFSFVGIATDSNCHILIADSRNECIHILDKVGHFLRYIKNCGLREPWGFCVDSSDNLFVAVRNRKVKKIRHCT